ncbi:MAG: hypothetical protein HS100_02020 [Anaerolineales bacterium]|nr:hypothetical protein [Anaerolineales bacterium]
MDTEYVLRGGPGQAAKLKGEPFPEDVLTGLNVEVVKPNVKDPYNDQLNFDGEGLYLIEKNPDKAPFRLAGCFLYKNIVNGVERPGYGYVWEWINPDRSIVRITTIASAKPNAALVWRPFASFNFTKDVNSPFLNEIAHDEEMNQLMLQWAETNIVPAELQDRALVIAFRFKE